MPAEDLTLWAAAGVYLITCTVTGDQYVGQTKCFVARLGQHVGDLSYNRHPVTAMQEDWVKYGPHAFTYEILEVVVDTDRLKLLEREQAWIDTLSPKYNMAISYDVTRSRRRQALRSRSSLAASNIKKARKTAKSMKIAHAQRKAELRQHRRTEVEYTVHDILDEWRASGDTERLSTKELRRRVATRLELLIAPSDATINKCRNNWEARIESGAA